MRTAVRNKNLELASYLHEVHGHHGAGIAGDDNDADEDFMLEEHDCDELGDPLSAVRIATYRCFSVVVCRSIPFVRRLCRLLDLFHLCFTSVFEIARTALINVC